MKADKEATDRGDLFALGVAEIQPPLTDAEREKHGLPNP